MIEVYDRNILKEAFEEISALKEKAANFIKAELKDMLIMDFKRRFDG